MEERPPSLLPSFLPSILQQQQQCRSEMSELFGGKGRKEGEREREREREGGGLLSVVPFLLSSLLFPALHCCPCPDGTRVNTSGGRPPVSQSVKSVSQRQEEGRKEGREPHCVLSAVSAPLSLSLPPSSATNLLLLSRETPLSSLTLFAIELAKKKINAAVVDGAFTFFSEDIGFLSPSVSLSSIGFIYWLG